MEVTGKATGHRWFNMPQKSWDGAELKETICGVCKERPLKQQTNTHQKHLTQGSVWVFIFKLLAIILRALGNQGKGSFNDYNMRNYELCNTFKRAH